MPANTLSRAAASEIALGELNEEGGISEIKLRLVTHFVHELPAYLTGPKPVDIPVEGGERILIGGNEYVGFDPNLLKGLRAFKFCYAGVGSGFYKATTATLVELSLKRSSEGCIHSTDNSRLQYGFKSLSRFAGNAVIYRNPALDGKISLLISLYDAVVQRARQIVKVSGSELILRGQM